jgi:hypothetical protein
MWTVEKFNSDAREINSDLLAVLPSMNLGFVYDSCQFLSYEVLTSFVT